MMQLIHCKECGGVGSGLDVVSVNLTLDKHTRCCQACNNIRTDTQHTFFCSLACFHAYMLKVVNGEAKVEWETYGFGTGGAIDK